MLSSLSINTPSCAFYGIFALVVVPSDRDKREKWHICACRGAEGSYQEQKTAYSLLSLSINIPTSAFYGIFALVGVPSNRDKREKWHICACRGAERSYQGQKTAYSLSSLSINTPPSAFYGIFALVVVPSDRDKREKWHICACRGAESSYQARKTAYSLSSLSINTPSSALYGIFALVVVPSNRDKREKWHICACRGAESSYQARKTAYSLLSLSINTPTSAFCVVFALVVVPSNRDLGASGDGKNEYVGRGVGYER